MSDNSVPGSKENLTVGEHIGVIQPSEPVLAPATAAPSTDQVTINTHLRKVESDLYSLSAYVDNFLGNHPVADDVLQSLQSAITVVVKNIK